MVSIDTPMKDALKAAMVSMDSTLRSNLSVGMPLDLSVIREGALDFAVQRRIEADDADFAAVSNRWSQALRGAFQALPDVTA